MSAGRSGRHMVLLDAAKFVGTSRLDLAKHRPEFVAISYYKVSKATQTLTMALTDTHQSTAITPAAATSLGIGARWTAWERAVVHA